MVEPPNTTNSWVSHTVNAAEVGHEAIPLHGPEGRCFRVGHGRGTRKQKWTAPPEGPPGAGDSGKETNPFHIIPNLADGSQNV